MEQPYRDQIELLYRRIFAQEKQLEGYERELAFRDDLVKTLKTEVRSGKLRITKLGCLPPPPVAQDDESDVVSSVNDEID